MPEGTVFFPNEPMLRVVAPIAQAQWLETRILNLVHFQTVIATKAARAVLAAKGRALIDFGLRRAHGAEAGALAARAAYLAGFAGTATAIRRAALRHPGVRDDGALLRAGARRRGAGVRRFRRVVPEQRDAADRHLRHGAPPRARWRRSRRSSRPRGIRIRGVRLDSGDLDALAREVRGILDAAGLRDAAIFASGNLDEHRVRGAGRGRRADLELRRRHQPHHQQRRAVPRRRLQAAGVRRHRAPQALREQGDVARPQAGVAARRTPTTRSRATACGWPTRRAWARRCSSA